MPKIRFHHSNCLMAIAAADFLGAEKTHRPCPLLEIQTTSIAVNPPFVGTMALVIWFGSQCKTGRYSREPACRRISLFPPCQYITSALPHSASQVIPYNRHSAT